MRRTGRARRWAKWAGAAVTVVMFAAGVHSTYRWMHWQSGWSSGRSVKVSLKGGGIGVICYQLRVDAVSQQAIVTALTPGWHRWRAPSGGPVITVWWPSVGKVPTLGTSISIPLWIPLLLVAALTGYLWWRDRPYIPPGHCARCGYNLTGLSTGGACPECGASPTEVTAGPASRGG